MPATETVLDNPIWHALAGTHASLARRHGAAAAYPFDMAPFAGLADPTDRPAWEDLAVLLGPAGRAALFVAEAPPVPSGFAVLRQRVIAQLEGPAVPPPPGPAPDGLMRLGPADVTDILDLVARTDPGPMQPRTVEMGRYLGVRDADGRLLAMAGERLAPAPWVEISGVCTDPTARGRGLAGWLERDRFRVIHILHA